MPAFNIVKEVKPAKTFRVSSIISQFDLQTEHIVEKFVGNIDIDNKKWSIGVIYGKSGTGKSTIAKQLFPNDYFNGFDYTAESVLDDMPKTADVKTIAKTFNSVGFSSPPSWLKPYSVLSTGEKMRVDLARSILEEKQVIVFDEFTSVVDRNVAKIGSFALQKAVRMLNKQFVAVTCHEDVIEWLEPDWVFNTDTMAFFLTQNINAQKLKLKYQEQLKMFGDYLVSITI